MIEGLLFDEARAFVSNLEPAAVEEWYAWKEGWPDWRSINEIEGLTEPIFRLMTVSPPAPPRGTSESAITGGTPTTLPPRPLTVVPKSAESSSFQQVNNDGSLVISPELGEFVVRAKRRFKTVLNAVIVGANGEQFKTRTRDISVGGVYFEDSLPEWATGYFKIRLSRPGTKQQIELTCALVDNQAPQARHRVAILPLESVMDEKNLEAWLAA